MPGAVGDRPLALGAHQRQVAGARTDIQDPLAGLHLTQRHRRSTPALIQPTAGQSIKPIIAEGDVAEQALHK